MSDKRKREYLVLACPFCGCLPQVESWHNARNGVLVSCVSDECWASPSVAHRGYRQTVDLWNGRAAIVGTGYVKVVSK